MATSYTIGKHYESFIKGLIDSGRYSTASEVMRDALRLVEEREERRKAKLEALRAEIQKGLDSGRPKKSTARHGSKISSGAAWHAWLQASMANRFSKRPRADADLDSIWRFVAVDNIDAANRLVDRIGSIFRMLTENPEGRTCAARSWIDVAELSGRQLRDFLQSQFEWHRSGPGNERPSGCRTDRPRSLASSPFMRRFFVSFTKLKRPFL